MMAQDDGQRWVKVEFYAMLQPGETVTDVDPTEIAQNLVRVFGFPAIHGLTIAAVEVAPSEEDKIRDAMNEATDHPGRMITR